MLLFGTARVPENTSGIPVMLPGNHHTLLLMCGVVVLLFDIFTSMHVLNPLNFIIFETAEGNMNTKISDVLSDPVAHSLHSQQRIQRVFMFPSLS